MYHKLIAAHQEKVSISRQRGMMKNSLLTIALGCILLLVTCSCDSTAKGTSTTDPTIPVTHALPSPTILQVTRIVPPATSLPPFDKTITNANEVQKLYRMALATPVVPKGAVIHCPAALAQYQYRLLFFHNKLIVSRVILNDEGCVFLSIASDPSTHKADVAFIDLFLQMIERSSLLS
jgi:hypothetical protein